MSHVFGDVVHVLLWFLLAFIAFGAFLNGVVFHRTEYMELKEPRIFARASEITPQGILYLRVNRPISFVSQ